VRRATTQSIIAVGAALAPVARLTAGSDGTGDDEAALADAMAGATGADGGTEGAEGTPSGEVTWGNWSPDTPVAEKYIVAFNEVSPDITVKYTNYENADDAPAMSTAFQAGSGRDIANGVFTELKTYDKLKTACGTFATELFRTATTPIKQCSEANNNFMAQEAPIGQGSTWDAQYAAAKTLVFWLTVTLEGRQNVANAMDLVPAFTGVEADWDALGLVAPDVQIPTFKQPYADVAAAIKSRHLDVSAETGKAQVIAMQ
jgi:hypothetical protein